MRTGSGPNESRETVSVQRRYNRQAATYDITETPMEFLLFGRLRKRLWREVTGRRVLEVGVGTGKNVAHYPAESRMVAIDISPKMVARAQSKAGRRGREVDMVVADAQRLPFRDGAFNSAAATFVFCSVPDPVTGLREVARVTDGQMHLLEHVRSANAVAGKIMDILNPLVVKISGANINRDTVRNVERAGIQLESLRSDGLGIVKTIRGAAPASAPRGAGEQAQTVQH